MGKRFRKLHRAKKKKSIFKNFYFWLLIIGIIISIFLFYFFCFHSFFKVKEIRVNDNKEVSAQDIISLVEKETDKDILFFQSESIFFVNLRKAEEKILDEFPKIAEVSLSKNYPDSIVIFVKERKPVAVFEQEGSYFFLDEKGIVFEKISGKDNWLVIKEKNQKREIDFGFNLIDEEKMGKILIASEELSSSKIGIDFIDIVNYYRFNVKTNEGWEIYFNSDGDIEQQALNLTLVLEKEISPERRENLEYVDLRFGNQVYYK